MLETHHSQCIVVRGSGRWRGDPCDSTIAGNAVRKIASISCTSSTPPSRGARTFSLQARALLQIPSHYASPRAVSMVAPGGGESLPNVAVAPAAKLIYLRYYKELSEQQNFYIIFQLAFSMMVITEMSPRKRARR